MNKQTFTQALKAKRPYAFTDDGISLLFDYFKLIDLNIPLRDWYIETYSEEIAEGYDVAIDKDPAQTIKNVTRYLDDNTVLIGVTPDNNIIYKDF